MIHSGSMLPESWYLLGVKKNLSHAQKTGSRYLLGFFFQSFNRHPNSFYMGAPKVVKPLSCLHILCFGILRSDYNDAGYYFGKYWRCIKINLTLFFMWSSFFSEVPEGMEWTLEKNMSLWGRAFSCFHWLPIPSPYLGLTWGEGFTLTGALCFHLLDVSQNFYRI